jgi:hypothetical protein
MDADEYDRYVLSKLDPRVLQRGPLAVLGYAIAKLNSEAGELSSLWAKREYHEADIPEAEFVLEAGDCQFYTTLVWWALGLTTRFGMALNRQKLDARGDYAAWLAGQRAAG